VSESRKWVETFKAIGGRAMEAFIDATAEHDVMTQAVLLIQPCRRVGRALRYRQRDKNLTRDQQRRLDIAWRALNDAHMALNLVFEDYPHDFEAQYEFNERYPPQ
jgi:hypothetical protein